MEILFVVLSMLCLAAIAVGLVEPDWVIRWGKARTKKNVIRYYGTGAWAMLTLGMGCSKQFSFAEALIITSMLACLAGFVIGMISPATVIVWGPKEERNRKKACLYYGTGFIGTAMLGLLAASTKGSFQWLGGLGKFVLTIALIVGMVNPEKLPALKPLEEKSRKAVLRYYGIGFLIVCLVPWKPAATEVIKEPAAQVTQNAINQNAINQNAANKELQKVVEIPDGNIAVTEENKAALSAEAVDEKAEEKDAAIADNEKTVDNEKAEGNEKEQLEEETTAEDTAKAETENLPQASTKVEESQPVKEQTVISSSSTSNEATVYWVPNGSVYHTRRSCSTLSRSKTILSGTKSESGKPRRCQKC